MESIQLKVKPPIRTGWECYLFGGNSNGMVYTPEEDQVPNVFIRWMMNVCLGCRWVKSSTISKG